MTPPANAIELLQQLIRIPSVNPHGDPGTPHTGEQAIAAWLADWLRHEFPGVTVELPEIRPARPNVVARFPSDRPRKPRVLFAPHTDTVSVLGMTIDPFGAEIRDGRIYGRGASDTKGSMAAMLWALRENRERLSTLAHEIWFAGLMGEETGQHGSKALAAAEPFHFVLAGEPTRLDTVYTHKGCTWVTLTATGTAAHASTPERGDNAIEKMLPLLDRLRADLAARFSQVTHPILGQPTFSIGTIHGGSKTNIVPDHCEVEIDLRTLPGQPDPVAHITQLVAACAPDIKVAAVQSPPLDTDPSHPLIAVLEQCGATPVGAPWFCDACIFAQHGTAAIAIGPGSIAQAHTPDEWIAIEDLENGVEFFSRFIGRL